MNVSPIYYNQKGMNNIERSVVQLNNKSACLKTRKRDSLEISATAYDLKEKEQKMTATSGKDILGITKGNKGNSFVIHFSDSAMVNRAVSRGYITVNGVDLELSEETKQQLLKIDEQAKAEREKAYYEYVMKHEMAVAKQQSETLRKVFCDMTEVFGIAAKISTGGKASAEELKKLMEASPQLYAMVQSTKMMPKQYEIQKMQYSSVSKECRNIKNGVTWSQFEWRTYDTQMTVSFEDTVKVDDISKGEIILS